jgi:hypothetical protein
MTEETAEMGERERERKRLNWENERRNGRTGRMGEEPEELGE